MIENIEKKENINLAQYSTMKTGGIGKIVYFPKTHLEVLQILKSYGEENCFVLGNGSNVLFSDKNFNKILISLKHFDKFKVCDSVVIVGAGLNLFKLNNLLCQNNLSGLEWSFGIPGTIGGLVYMNGGSFGSEICQFVKEILVIEDQKLKCIKREDINFEYRSSNLKNTIILQIKLCLTKSNKETILKNMTNFYNIKKEKQPCDIPSLGSVFKINFDKEIVYPAKLIDNLGLKGVKIGGAEISQKHAGFIVNSNHATSKDVLDLVEFVEQKAKENGVTLKREIIVL